MKNPFGQKKEALIRIETLFEQAEKRPAYAKRYVELARTLSLRTRTKIPMQYRKRFCSHCNALFSSANSQRRVRTKNIVITCIGCGQVTRIPKEAT